MKKGFSLVELLVVIGIIAVLSGVLIASLSGSTESANAAKCMANMRTLAMGCVTYASEHDYFPPAGSFTRYKDMYSDKNKQCQQRGWIAWNTVNPSGNYVSPYCNDREGREFCLTNGAIWKAINQNRSAFVCPTHKKLTDIGTKGALKEGPAWSYVMNGWFYWNTRGSVYSYSRRGQHHSLGRADRILLLAELPALELDVQSPQFSSGATLANDPILQYKGQDKGGESIGFNHRSGKRDIYAHVAFADGHIEKFKLPPNPDSGNIQDLTSWLCYPKDKDTGKQFDVTFDGKRYSKTTD